MNIKVLKIYFLYSFLYLIIDIVIELILVFLFGQSFLKSIFAVLFGVIFAWIIGYKGVKALSKVPGADKLGKPYNQGMSIILFASFFGAIIAYLLTKQVALTGILYILGGAHGGKLAAENISPGTTKAFKIIVVIVFVFFAIIAVPLSLKSASYRLFDLKSERQGQLIKYTDKRFTYSFTYPGTWKKQANAFTPGYVIVTSDKDPQTSVGFWYKDSSKINNIDELRKFVENDAKYSEENQKGQLISIDEVTLAGKRVILSTIKYVTDNGYSNFKQYYVADFNAKDQNIYVWIVWVETKNKTSTDDPEKVKSVINSFTLL